MLPTFFNYVLLKIIFILQQNTSAQLGWQLPRVTALLPLRYSLLLLFEG